MILNQRAKLRAGFVVKRSIVGLARQCEGRLEKRPALAYTTEQLKGWQRVSVVGEEFRCQPVSNELDLVPIQIPEAGHLVLLELLQSGTVQINREISRELQ